MRSTEPLVTVVIPSYNRADFLPDAIGSVFGQTYRNWEIVVVDDGSTDNTREVVESYGGRVTHLPQPHSGLPAARNTGIRAARGEFVAFLDSDDLWLPDKLQLQLDIFRAHPEVGLVGGGCIFINLAKQPIRPPRLGSERVRYADFALQGAIATPGSGSNAMVRRAVFDEVGCFDEALLAVEDRDMWLRISEKFEIRTVQEPTVLIRLHPTPRPYRNFETLRACRMRINAKIKDPALRRKADAVMYFDFFMMARARGERLPALRYLLRSVMSHPRKISPRTYRLQAVAAELLPLPVYGLARSIRQTFTRQSAPSAGFSV